MGKDFSISSSAEIERRAEMADEFLAAVLDADERPFLVTDAATVYDLFAGDEAEIVSRCESHYGVRLTPAELAVPFWRLLDELETRRVKRPLRGS